MSERTQKIIEEYWIRKLSGKLEPARLPAFESGKLEQAAAKAKLRLSIPDRASARLKQMSKGSDTACFVLFLTGLSVVLERYTGIQDLLLGTWTPLKEGQPQQPVLLRRAVTGDRRLDELVDQTWKTVSEAFNHADCSFPELVRRVRARNHHNPLDALTITCAYDKLHGPVGHGEQAELSIVLEETSAGLALRCEYDPQQYDTFILERFSKNVIHLLANFPEHLKQPVGEIEIVSPEEKSELLAFNQTASDYPRDKTLQELFEEQVALHPDKPAVLFEDTRITYRELDEKTNRLAHTLRSRGVGPDVRVVLMVEPFPEAIIGIVATIKAGGCYVPMNPNYPEARKRLILQDTGTPVLLTTRREMETARPLLAADRILCLDDPAIYADDFTNPTRLNRPNDLAYVLYTSGTTGRPKGVMVQQRGVIRLVRNTNYIQFDENDRILRSSPLEFDVSTLEIWGALLNGLTLCMERKEQLLEPEPLKALIEQFQITTLWLTSPLFAQHAQADVTVFRRLKYLVTGGDIVSPYFSGLVKRHYPGLTIINAYGPTENTTISSAFSIDREYPARVPIGKPIANSTAYIVDENRHLQPIGAVGELYVGGDGVARGYLNDPALTHARFFPFVGEERVYKTGDLARWMPDGNIEFLGRIDDQVKIRGYRVEPGEIEDRLLHHPAVKDGVVLAIQDKDGQKALCAYLVCDHRETRELKDYLARELPEYMVPAYFVYLDKLPLTLHGKIDRRQLPAPAPRSDDGSGAPRDEMEARLAAIWKEVLGMDQVGIHDDFFDIGGHSMKAIQLIGQVHEQFQVKLGLQHVLKSITIADMAELIRQVKVSPYVVIDRQPSREFYELSVSQRRLAELYEEDPGNAAFNICQRCTWQEPLDEAIVRRVLAALVERHDSLRAYFKKVDGRYVEVIDPTGSVRLETCDLSHLSPEERQAKRDRLLAAEEALPFKLTEAPLYRVKLVKCSDDEFDVLWTVHHIVADGWSMDVLETEFARLYERYRDGEESDLEPPRLEFKDYTVWHNQLLADPARVQPAQAFWHDLLRPPLPVLALPYDFEKTTTGVGRRSSGHHSVISEETTQRLRAMAKNEKTSLFLILFAGFNLLLYELSGQKDIITGIPSANRYHEGLKDVVGFLVDSVVIRTRIDPDEPLTALLQRVSENTLSILDHAYYPIELACDTVHVTWPEILTTFFNMTTFGDVNRKVLLDTRWYPIAQVQNAKMELVLYLTEYRNGVEINTHYYNELFKPATVERIMRRYASVVEQLANGYYEPVREPLAARAGQKQEAS